jgi:phycoerythrin-associated linker protein
MVSTFINTRVNSDAQLGVRSFDDTPPIRLAQYSSETEVQIAIRAVYQQILGNAHVMESERLVVAESQLKQGNISVREFVRQVAQSDLYRHLFFETCSRTRSIELNFKHLLGRAPESHVEIAEHGRVLDEGGFKAEISAYVDSDEYLETFGEEIVPYYRGNKSQTGKKMVGFTHLFQLLRGSASSDKDPLHNNRSRLNTSLMSDRPSVILPVTGAPLSRQSSGQISDVSKILAEVFKSPSSSTPVWNPTRNYAAERDLQQLDLQQAQTIEQLEKQLADLRPFASIGSSYLNHPHQPDLNNTPERTFTALARQVDAQTIQIAKLQDQIADARRYATIGEARLNKWRSRVFNG